MVDPHKIVSEAEIAANRGVQAQGPKVLAWFAHPVPVWVAGLGFLLGCVVARIAA
jgi:hypothetical protein